MYERERVVGVVLADGWRTGLAASQPFCLLWTTTGSCFISPSFQRGELIDDDDDGTAVNDDRTRAFSRKSSKRRIYKQVSTNIVMRIIFDLESCRRKVLFWHLDRRVPWFSAALFRTAGGSGTSSNGFMRTAVRGFPVYLVLVIIQKSDFTVPFSFLVHLCGGSLFVVVFPPVYLIFGHQIFTAL